ncbi:MAG: ester cyclase, partial [Devosia sp.]
MPSASVEVTNKRFVMEAIAAIAASTQSGLSGALASAYHPDAEWRGSHPLNEMSGLDAIASKVWAPLLKSFPDLERRDSFVAAGTFQGSDLVATMGHYCGTFREDWLGIPATGRAIYLRSGEVHRIENGRIRQSTVLIDILDVIRQAGFWPLAPSLGREGRWPAPLGLRGISLEPSDPAESAETMARTLAMQNGIHAYTHNAANPRESYLASSQQQFWHPKMMWYGPSGVGTVRGWQNYVDYHAVPWITAFPDRSYSSERDYVEIADGPLSVTGGWPSGIATHRGGNLFGVGPTGR